MPRLVVDIHPSPPKKQQVNLVTSFNIVKASVRGMIQEEGHHHLQHNNNNNNNKSEPRQQAAASSTTSSSPGRRGGGSIVLVSAALASHGIPAYEAMSAAKAAVEGGLNWLVELVVFLKGLR